MRLIEMNSSTGTNMMNSASTSSAAKPKRVAKKTDEVAPAAVAPVAAPAPAPAAPVAEVKKTAARKAAAPAAVAPVAAASASVSVPVAAAPVAAVADVAAAPATTLDDDLKSVLTTLTSLRETVSSMITEVKRVHREIKDARKRKRRVPKEGEEGVKRGPSIFEIPTKVTDELCRFLGKPTGTLISRSNVTKELNNYVKTHNLKIKHDIKPDGPLRKLLQVPETDQLTYFNLQKYLNKHYIKEVKPVPAA